MGLIKTGIVQLGAGGTKDENLAKALRMIDEALERFGPLDLLVLPEYCNGEPTIENVAEMAEQLPGPFSEAMAEKARLHKVNLVSGSFAEPAPDGRAHNTTLIFNRKGEEVGRYRKIHLIDALGFVESSFIAAGDELCVVDLDIGRVGLEVCYDLRFPEQAKTMALQGAEIIVVPAAFPSGALLPPRTDHWDTLITSTALLNLCYIVAANQFGKLPHDHPFGRSAIIDPWGISVAKAQGKEDIVCGEIDLNFVKELRQKLPTLEQRRPDLYDVS